MSDAYQTPQQIVERCNELARTFYKMQGCNADVNFKFYEAHHPLEVGCWNMAVVAYDHIEGTDVQDCLDEIRDTV